MSLTLTGRKAMLSKGNIPNLGPKNSHPYNEILPTTQGETAPRMKADKITKWFLHPFYFVYYN